MLKIFFEKMLQKNLTFSFVSLFVKSILLLSHFMLYLYTIMPFFMAAFLSIENETKKQ